MHAELLERLPHRADDIYYIPFGIPVPPRVRSAAAGPLRLIFAGRLDRQKGVLELPAIDASLRDRRVDVTWTIVGDGPDGNRMRAEWPESSRVRYRGVLTNDETVACLACHDVFVLPTRSEGLPVALLEAMASGLVAVVSNIPGGVPDVVTAGVTGFLPEIGDIEGFADAIARLAADRGWLERFSGACRQLVTSRFDIRDRVKDYQALYARYTELYRPLPPDALQYGSRLDHPWIPNSFVRAVRSALRVRSR
jgi:glycosyltransferase involved in cell wall biosynthesis